MAVLLVESGPRKGTRIAIPAEGTITLGSDPSRAAGVLDDPLVAPLHCVVGRAKGGGLGLKDLGSENGTFVNDRRVVSGRLAAGDKLQVGGTILTVLEETEASRAAGDLVGRELGGYRILEHLGRGGMGTVYKALQISLDRVVALKVLPRELAGDASFVERFLREARAAGQLNHPNVVQVYDVGTDGDRAFFSMEFMEGGTVEDRVLREGKLPLVEGLRILRDASRALLFAEEKGIVHRDVKPGNLMIGPHASAKLADLGLAAEIEKLDRGEGIFGTPHFIAPEQARGAAVDARSDLYSLGASTYRMLTGKTPFSGKTVREILRAQLKETPPPLRSIDASIPLEVEAIVARCLAKDPAERFPSARDLLQALEPVLDRLEGKRRGVSPVWLAAAGLLVAGAGVALLVWKPWEKRTVVVEVPGAAPVAPTGGGEEVEALRRENAEKDARLAYLEVPSDLADEARAAALEAVASRFGGTEFGERASREAVALREAATARAEAAAERARRADAALAAAQSAADGASGAGKFADAGRLAAAAPGIAEFAADEAFAARLDAVYAGIEQAAAAEVARAESDADARLASGDWDGARARFERVAAAVAPTEGLPFRLREPFERHARLAEEGIAEVEAARARARADAFAADRAAAHEARFAPAGSPALFAAFRFAGAKERLAAAAAGARTDPYRRLLEQAVADAESMERAFARLVARARAGGLRPDGIADPVSGKIGRIVDADAESGLTVEVLVRGQAARSVLRWDRFDRPDRLAEILAPRYEATADEAADAAILALHAGLSLEARLLAPSLAAIRSGGEGTSMPAEPPARIGEVAFRTTREWLDRPRPNGDSTPRLDAARAALERETRAAAALEAALAPLFARRYDEAADRLEAFRDGHRASFLFGLVSDGTTPPVEEPK